VVSTWMEGAPKKLDPKFGTELAIQMAIATCSGRFSAWHCPARRLRSEVYPAVTTWMEGFPSILGPKLTSLIAHLKVTVACSGKLRSQNKQLSRRDVLIVIFKIEKKLKPLLSLYDSPSSTRTKATHSGRQSSDSEY